MTTPPQDDVTAERAAISLLLNRLNGYDGACITDIAQEKDIDLILQRDKQTRQEALREARRDVLEVLGLLDAALTPSVSEMDIFAAGKLIKETIARLASEGGLGC